jgi:hypothetical protein
MWAKLDDNFPDHPKVRAYGVFSVALQAAAICYCSRYLTDGFLSYSVVDQLIASIMTPFTEPDGRIVTPGVTSGFSGQDAVEWDWKTKMIEAGLWEPTKGGVLVHDYLKYNPTRASVLKERERTAARVAKLRGQRKGGGPSDDGGGVSNTVTYPQESNAVTTPVVRRSRPLESKTKNSTAFDLKGPTPRLPTRPTRLGSLLPALGPPPTLEQDLAAQEAARRQLKP